MKHETIGTNQGKKASGEMNHSVDRRRFLQMAGLGAMGLAASRQAVMAGPFSAADFEILMPADKKLGAGWIKNLYERGEPQFYQGDDLKFIGMPIGGIGAGQLYLGGDGKLWHWDIFNQAINTGNKGPHYANPVPAKSSVRQDFVLTVDGMARPLDKTGFSNIRFRGEYPIGRVQYLADDVEVNLEAFSPFIPLNTDDSSLPATVMSFTVKNTSAKPIEATLSGSLENVVARGAPCTRRNRIVEGGKHAFMECSAQETESKDGKGELEKRADFGTMGFSLLGNPPEISTTEGPVGVIGRKIKLAPGTSQTITFVLTWHFPNLRMGKLSGGRYYATKFDSAKAVADYVVADFDRLAGQTRLWRDTWYDSTLPYWFLDRSMISVCCLASSTSYRFKDGRFYGWEGVGCCEGTCGHVWYYAQAMARLFPELERNTRERVDFGLAIRNDGSIPFRGEFNQHPAVDSQAGCILRAYREHQISVDDAFLKRNWKNIKLALGWLINRDTNRDGVIEGPQHNTLDQDWFGEVAWLSGVYLAALRAGEEMALEMNDPEFAEKCAAIFKVGGKSLVDRLFNGEYFIQVGHPDHLKTVGSYDGCQIDQVIGQSWAYQVALGEVLPNKETRIALESLWKYNFTPDVGPYRKAYPAGRWYAMAGEAGTLMCSWPKGDAKRVTTGYDFYFNECMNGFEYQVASHMIWENMLMEGLAITRAVHDRYDASRRNPWNEVECGDHYARSMASYGVFIAACGFEYHGPKGHIGFAPRMTPEAFKAPFTAAEGWGVFEQTIQASNLKSHISVKHGKLRVKTISLGLPAGLKAKSANVVLAGVDLKNTLEIHDGKALITLSADAVIDAGAALQVMIA